MTSGYVQTQPWHAFPAPVNYSEPENACGNRAYPGEITVETPAGAHLEFEFAWPFNHEGSFAFYMAECGGECQDVKLDKLEWFKIYEEGLLHVNPDGTKNESSRMCKFNFFNIVAWFGHGGMCVSRQYYYSDVSFNSKEGTNFDVKGERISILAKYGHRTQNFDSSLK